MTTNELQGLIVQGIDNILEAPILRRFLSAEQKRVLRAQRRYWQNDNGAQLTQLLRFYESEPRSAEEAESAYGYCPHCGTPGVSRERTLNGNDVCENGHVYPSRSALYQKGQA